MNTFGMNLVQTREEKGLSQKKLAELLEITPTRLNYWEKDKRQPDIEMIKKISAVLHISPSELLNWDEQYNPNGKLADEVKLCELIDNYHRLNEPGKQKACEYVSDLTESEKYTKKEPPSASTENGSKVGNHDNK